MLFTNYRSYLHLHSYAVRKQYLKQFRQSNGIIFTTMYSFSIISSILYKTYFFFEYRIVYRFLRSKIQLKMQSEEALQESESRFRNLIADTPLLILIYQDNKIFYANYPFELFMGYRQEDNP